MNTSKSDIDRYIERFPKHIRTILEEIRVTVKQAAPTAEETIKYGMPTFVLQGNLVHFAAFENHIGFYSAPAALQEEFSAYKSGKGSLRFPLDKPVPFHLITKIVQQRMKENSEKAGKKKMLRTCKNGHRYHKSSDCPTCPICEHKKKSSEGFLVKLSAPARRALENNNLIDLNKISKLSEKEILKLHGIGPASLPILRKALSEQGLKFGDHDKE